MDVREAITWLQAILGDTLDPEDEGDRKRIEAVNLAIDVLERREGCQLERPTGRSS